MMTDEEKRKYGHLMIAMSTDFLMGKITWETYKTNLDLICNKIKTKETEDD